MIYFKQASSFTSSYFKLSDAIVSFSTQFVICKRKLESKKEALLILSKELDTCQQERDQYKLMANQLRERHQGLKKKYRELIVSQHWGLKMHFCWRNGESRE